jgi:hypothetical protein
MKSRDGAGQRREDKNKKNQRRENQKKTQVREKVRMARFTDFFQ